MDFGVHVCFFRVHMGITHRLDGDHGTETPEKDALRHRKRMSRNYYEMEYHRNRLPRDWSFAHGSEIPIPFKAIRSSPQVMTLKEIYKVAVYALSGQFNEDMVAKVSAVAPFDGRGYVLQQAQYDLSRKMNKYLRKRENIVIQFSDLLKVQKWHWKDIDFVNKYHSAFMYGCQNNVFHFIRMALLNPEKVFCQALRWKWSSPPRSRVQ